MTAVEHEVSETILGKGRRVPICGFPTPRFELVLEVFKQNFRDRQEIGAACAAYVSGRCVVDLWGGFRTLKRDDFWKGDTMVILMSTTKGLAALVSPFSGQEA